LPRSFYARDSRDLAPDLLNKLLVADHPDFPRVAVRLVEVEAYAGEEDPGSHAYRGETPRNRVMFGPPGYLYVYFTYGMHWCSNVVGGADGVASAVLLRAGAPLAGIDLMRARRGPKIPDRRLCAGPACLTQALGIGGEDDGNDLVRGRLRIVDDGTPPPRRPGRSARIGLHPGVGTEHDWRWFVDGDVNVSRHAPTYDKHGSQNTALATFVR
jgi:DNA-3-methyladenine glycosylase